MKISPWKFVAETAYRIESVLISRLVTLLYINILTQSYEPVMQHQKWHDQFEHWVILHTTSTCSGCILIIILLYVVQENLAAPFAFLNRVLEPRYFSAERPRFPAMNECHWAWSSFGNYRFKNKEATYNETRERQQLLFPFWQSPRRRSCAGIRIFATTSLIINSLLINRN